jgi:hypothetical protein
VWSQNEKDFDILGREAGSECKNEKVKRTNRGNFFSVVLADFHAYALLLKKEASAILPGKQNKIVNLREH